MVNGVNPSRKYDATGRQEQARATRRAVLAVATRMFVEGGYAHTTVGAVADAAGVSVETIYKTIGKKPALAKACFDIAVVGDDEPVPLMERDDGIVARTQAERDPRKKLVMFGAHVGESLDATGPIQLVVKAAAATDADAAAIWEQLQNERLTGMGFFALHLKKERHLRKGVSADDARDILWTYLSVEPWELLVRERGWSTARYGKWIGEQLIAALL